MNQVFEDWFEKGISKVKYLQTGNNKFVTLNDFAPKYYIILCPLCFIRFIFNN